MDLKQLQCFVASVDSGSLKRASEMLYTSQPHVSKMIKALETELQVKLLTRRSHGVEVTEAGRKVYEYAHRILVDSDRIQKIRESGVSRILSIASGADSRLAELFRTFYTEELKCAVQARYTECGMEEIFQHIHRHTAELGFIHADVRQMTALGQLLEYRRLEFQEIGKGDPLLFVGPKNPLYHEVSVTGRELKNLQYVQLYDEQDELGINLIEGSEDYRSYRSRGQVLVTGSRQMVTEMLLTTALASIGCGLSVRTDGRGMLRGIPIKGTRGQIAFGFIRRKRGNLSPEAEAFVSYVKKHWKF